MYQSKCLLAYADGACSSNGSYGDAVAEASFAVYELPRLPRKDEDHFVIRDRHTPLVHVSRAPVQSGRKNRPTNNLAEATALLMAASWLQSRGAFKADRVWSTVRICMDSELILFQMSGLYKTKSSSLLEIYRSIMKIMPADMVDLSWIPGTVMKKTIIAH